MLRATVTVAVTLEFNISAVWTLAKILCNKQIGRLKSVQKQFRLKPGVRTKWQHCHKFLLRRIPRDSS